MILIGLVIASIIVGIVFLCTDVGGHQVPDMSFETAFKKRIGQDPASYIAGKLSGGSDVGAVRYLFDIVAAEVEKKSKDRSPGFDFYYKKVINSQKPQVAEVIKPQIRITKEFAASQLIGGVRFVKSYDELMKKLAASPAFIQFVAVLREELSGREVTDTKKANREVADYFYHNKANEKFPEVLEIVKEVTTYGKQASAHISIYYAMFLYEK